MYSMYMSEERSTRKIATNFSSHLVMIQPVPGKMRLEMVIGIQNEILDGER